MLKTIEQSRPSRFRSSLGLNVFSVGAEGGTEGQDLDASIASDLETRREQRLFGFDQTASSSSSSSLLSYSHSSPYRTHKAQSHPHLDINFNTFLPSDQVIVGLLSYLSVPVRLFWFQLNLHPY